MAKIELDGDKMWLMRESINYFFSVINYLIIARIIMSWLSPNPYSKIARILYQVTEPILAPFRNLLAMLGLRTAQIDFSPILAVWVLNIIRVAILRLLPM